MSTTSQKPAFSLLELLVTAALFVVIAGLTTSIFAGVSKLQLTRKGSQALVAQVRQAEQQMSSDVQTSPKIQIFPYGFRPDLALLVQYGNPPLEWRIYCLQTNQALKVNQLVRLHFTFTGSIPRVFIINSCTTAGVVFGPFIGSTGPSSTDYLTDSQSTIQTLNFVKLSGDIAVNPTFSGQTNAVRATFSALDSAVDPTGTPIIFTSVLNRLSQ